MIRDIKDSDIKSVYDIYIPYILNTNISFEITPPSFVEFKERVNKITSLYPYLVCEYDGEVVGYVYASRFRQREAYDNAVEVSIYIKKEYQHKKIGYNLMIELLKRLKKQNVMSVISCITYPNHASEHLCETLGFQKCGHMHKIGVKKGVILDITFYEYILNDTYQKFIPYHEVCYE